jgi:hypothetical protein
MISAIGFRPGHRGAHRGAEDRLLGDRAILHAPLAELLEQPTVDLNTPPGLADVLAEEDDIRIARHLLRDAAGDRLAIGQFRHAQPPSHRHR